MTALRFFWTTLVFTTRYLMDKGLPTVAELAQPKIIRLEYIPLYSPHLNPMEFNFNTVRALLKGQEAWTQNKLAKALAAVFKSELLAKESMTKLFKSVIWGGA